ncbi:class C beta-lactamase-related serine hydrolase [Marinilabiliaceae bacterium JC017]|nr:class C beta-lactamase-related serine hydrolase [Marinilabiliaceae bacterium JC017]
MKKRHFTFLGLSIALILALVYLLTPFHVKKAIIYWYPGIEDHQIFKNRTVAASDTPSTWPYAHHYNQYQLPAHWRDSIETYKSVAFLVIQNDSLLYEEYWDGFHTHSHSNIFSATKSIVSLLIGAAIDEGKIQSINQKVGDFLPQFKKGKNAQLTIAHLLTMSSGSNWEESYSSPFSMTTEAYYGNNMDHLISKIHITDTPGQYFSYKSGDTQLLSHLLTEAVSMPLAHYASQKLWQPLGARTPALWSLDTKAGREKAYCCFNSNARDVARLGALVLHRGHWHDQQIISEAYINAATTPASHLLDKHNQPVDFYGYQWWIAHLDGLTIPYARGILGQYIFVIPKKNAVVVRLGHKRSWQYKDHHPVDIFNYLNAALDIMEKKEEER